MRGERLSVKKEGRIGGSGLGSDLDLDLDPDPWKILWIWIWIRQNDADPLDPDPDPQHCFQVKSIIVNIEYFTVITWEF